MLSAPEVGDGVRGDHRAVGGLGGVRTDRRGARSGTTDCLAAADSRCGHRGANTPAIRARRRIIKGTRWVLLHLWVVYVLKDALKELWRYTYVGAALHS